MRWALTTSSDLGRSWMGRGTVPLRTALAVAVSREAESRATAHAMAKGAAHGSLLSRISGRQDTSHRDGYRDGH
jgi:hypothetical protein